MNRAIIHTPDYANLLKCSWKISTSSFCFVLFMVRLSNFWIFHCFTPSVPLPASFSINLGFLLRSVFTSVTSGAFCWVLSTMRTLRSTWHPCVESGYQGSQATEPGPSTPAVLWTQGWSAVPGPGTTELRLPRSDPRNQPWAEWIQAGCWALF